MSRQMLLARRMNMMTFLRILILGICSTSFLTVTPLTLAKAYFATEGEMIERSEAIAIVEISQVDDTPTKGRHWTYRQKADATVRQTIKGALPPEITIHGDEDFICAQVHLQPGRFLVFLARDGELFVGSNWHLSVRPIKDTEVEWYVPGERLKLSWQPLDSVLGRVADLRSR